LQFFLVCLNKVPDNFSIDILVGNKGSYRLEVYPIKFTCKNNICSTAIVKKADIKWQSPTVVPSMTEVKRVIYLGQDAIATVIDKGVMVMAYPSGKVLFQKSLSGIQNIHSCEVLPDGNVVYADSYGKIGILYKDNNLNQSPSDTTMYDLKSAHGVVYHIPSNFIYALGYLKILKLSYQSGSNKRGTLKLEEEISFEKFYESKNHNEGHDVEDGGHDLNPYRNKRDILIMSTGERVFLF